MVTISQMYALSVGTLIHGVHVNIMTNNHLPQNHYQITYNHLPKAGGNFISSVLRHCVIPRKDVRIEPEPSALKLSDRERFKIGSIRNPCEYYVSLFAFPGNVRRELTKQGYGYLYNDDSLDGFKHWLQVVTHNVSGNISGTSPLGLLSVRFLHSYACVSGAGDPSYSYCMNKPQHARAWSDETHFAEVGQSAMDEFDLSSMDCWVAVENIVDDLKRCLSIYESKGGIVDWDKFDEAIGSANQNPSNHRACSAYVDKESEALIRRADKGIFKLFGYDSCCAH